mmetsp:Transcript_5111/g.7334  ORF Transcript_5111/g.7334 Transcript_5111/m.7334 type:complete len:212 (-) Transcript_5111:126-761(-)
MVNREDKTIRFAPEKNNTTLFMPCRSEISLFERKSIWYQQKEIDDMKTKARSISRVLRWVEESKENSTDQCNANTHKKLKHANLQPILKQILKETSSSSPCYKFCASGCSIPDKYSSSLSSQEKEQILHASRGLEHRISIERQRRTRLTIRTIVKCYARMDKDDTRLSVIARKISHWATILALETGAVDAAIAAHESSIKTNRPFMMPRGA